MGIEADEVGEAHQLFGTDLSDGLGRVLGDVEDAFTRVLALGSKPKSGLTDVTSALLEAPLGRVFGTVDLFVEGLGPERYIFEAS